MKKLLLSLAAVTVAAFSATAATVEFDLTSGYGNGDYVTDAITKDGVTIQMFSNTNNNGPKWYTTGTGVRLYGSNSLEVKSDENIQSVTFTFSAASYNFYTGTKNNNPTVTPGSYTENGASGVWTVGANSGTLTVGGTSGHARIQKITVETGGAAMETAATPVISPESGTTFGNEGLEVSITAGSGAKIYYTVDGSNPTKESTLYSAPIKLTESTTVKAFAVEEGKNDSPVASASYVYERPLNPDEKEVSFVFKENGYENAADMTSVTKDGVSLVFGAGENEKNSPKYYTSGESVRMYGANTFTVSADKEIAYVELTYSQAYDAANAPSVNPGTYALADLIGTWTVGASSGTYTVGGTSGQIRISAVKVVLNTQAVVTPTAQAPVFTPGSGEIFSGELKVSIAAGEGATIYYTLDGTEPTDKSDKYEADIVLTKTTTIKAFAAEEGKNNSAVVSATYTMQEGIETLAELIEQGLKDENTEFLYTGTAAVTYQNGSNLYIQDESGAILVFGSNLPEYKNGDRISGFQGKFKNYFSTYELMATASSFKAGEAGAAVEPKVMDIEDITPEMQNQYVKINKVKVDAANSKLVDEIDADILYYNKFKLETIPSDENDYDVTGIVCYYQSKGADAPELQINPISFDKTTGVEAVAEQKAEVYVSGNMIVAPEGAAVYSVSGARVNGANVANGVYVVRLANGEAVKVLVK